MGLQPSSAVGTGSIPGLGANTPCASGPKNQNIKKKKKKKKKQYCNKLSKDFENCPGQTKKKY